MKTKEERAEIARQNGAKSKGPKIEAGKQQSKRNAIIHGERATALLPASFGYQLIFEAKPSAITVKCVDFRASASPASTLRST